MHICSFEALYPRLELISDIDPFFNSIKERFPEYLRRGLFQELADEAVFIYQIRSSGRLFTGLLAGADIRDFLEGRVKRHENTLHKREQQQVQLLLDWQGFIKPVLLAYRESPRISRWIHARMVSADPVFHLLFENDQQEHLLWEIRQPDAIAEIQELFAREVPLSYIADGHHRLSSLGLLYQQAEDQSKHRFQSFLSAFFPVGDLAIHAFNRIVKIPADQTEEELLAHLKTVFEWELLPAPALPSRKHELSMLFRQKWYRLRWQTDVLKRYSGESILLDSMLLNELVMQEILGMEDVRSDRRIDYIEGPKGVEGLWLKVGGRPDVVGFCLYPVQPEEFLAMSDLDKVLPPKSTWFEPRMKNGIVVLRFPE